MAEELKEQKQKKVLTKTGKTRKLCYRKDDRAMRPIGLHGARKKFMTP